MPRPRLHRDEDLLAGVKKALRAHGNGVPVRVLADAAGVSAAVLYQRFGDKEGVVLAALSADGPDIEGLERHEGEEVQSHLNRLADIAFGHFTRGLADTLLVWTHPSDRARAEDGRREYARAFEAALDEDDHRQARAELLVAAAHELALAVVVDGLDRGIAQQKLRARCACLALG